MDNIFDEFEELLVQMACNDGSEPQGMLDFKLNSLTIYQRIKCLNYLLNEFKSGRINKEGGLWHQRYNDPFFWDIDTPTNEMHGTLVVDDTMGKLCDLLINYVPNRLQTEERRLNNSMSHSINLDESSMRLELSSNKLLEDETIFLFHNEAAELLGVSASWLYKKNKTEKLLYPVTLPGSSTNRYSKKNLIAFKSHLVTKTHREKSADKVNNNSAAASAIELRRYYRKGIE
ncbi:hypothetical protein H8B13_18915 [Hymenobacter sp. BT188]|uniref:hypothetical protein n=1 Tax=Hymenobacter sp. BT188 TaxID=2763504 RepID=UPI001650F833|nr:hypothetical protein [Hymenobacter sp. BT188]MBC6608900.1 hypothetical protein [Hymenobacter sp. BT188]